MDNVAPHSHLRDMASRRSGPSLPGVSGPNSLPYSVHIFKDGTFFGEIEDGHPSDYGMFLFKTGNVYIGSWSDGRPNGFGYLYFLEGGFYYGKIELGLASGHGIYF